MYPRFTNGEQYHDSFLGLNQNDGLGGGSTGGSLWVGDVTAYDGPTIGDLIDAWLTNNSKDSFDDIDFTQSGFASYGIDTAVQSGGFQSQKDLEDYINKNIGNVAMIEKALNTKIFLITDANIPNGYQWGAYGSVIETDGGRSVGGLTFPPSKGSSKSKIFIAPTAKYMSGIERPGASNVYIIHEFIHAMGFAKGFVGSENAAYTYNVAYFKTYGDQINANYYRFPGMQKYHSQESWRRLPTFINTGLKR